MPVCALLSCAWLCFLWMLFEHLSLQFTCRLFIYSIHNDSLRQVNWTITTFTRDYSRVERKSLSNHIVFIWQRLFWGLREGAFHWRNCFHDGGDVTFLISIFSSHLEIKTCKIGRLCNSAVLLYDAVSSHFYQNIWASVILMLHQNVFQCLTWEAVLKNP